MITHGHGEGESETIESFRDNYLKVNNKDSEVEEKGKEDCKKLLKTYFTSGWLLFIERSTKFWRAN